ncbi:MAG: bifunctional methylenetetrahydrofolate dehydrogenase/methenyltetrahydrofolate cyclohydrolase FolD [Ignavibacteria bacterium]|nr:bifunctional methylenetetrahydrofolate dehydrogenase/methenyltetrahydrofolate cyclohydrolase FolD [Ignavibacteria bacterium]
MKAVLLDGKSVASKIRNRLKQIVEKEFKSKDIKPGLVAILVGNNPASKIYVGSKVKACEEVGIFSEVIELPENTSENELINLIKELNVNPKFHGILVQQPLPSHISTEMVNENIDFRKDVDGFHPYNLGKLLLGEEGLKPCTPLGIIKLLTEYEINLNGKDVVVIGRSNIVGKPLAVMLMQKWNETNSTVTVCHSSTRDIKKFTASADVVIAAMGKPEFLSSDFIKDGAIVIDVGINRIEDDKTAKGYRIVGDVKFDEISSKASYVTPVPGGVGPMTIAMLLQNTIIACSKFYGININV